MYKIIKNGKVSYKATLDKSDADRDSATLLKVAQPEPFYVPFQALDLGAGKEEDGVWVAGAKTIMTEFGDTYRPSYFNILSHRDYNTDNSYINMHKLILRSYGTKICERLNKMAVKNCDSNAHWGDLARAANDYLTTGDTCSALSMAVLTEAGPDNLREFSESVIDKALSLAVKTSGVRGICRAARKQVTDEGSNEEQTERFIKLLSGVIKDCENLTNIPLKSFF
jgi:hypothetical protein